jgi:hypothetical protein
MIFYRREKDITIAKTYQNNKATEANSFNEAASQLTKRLPSFGIVQVDRRAREYSG